MPQARYLKPILPQPDYPNDPQRSLEFFQRLDNENNVLPLEDWKQCFDRRDASAPNEIVPGLYLGNIKTAAHCLLGYDVGEQPVTHILSILQVGGRVRWKLPELEGAGTSIKRLTLNRRDTSRENILRDFDRTSAFIHEAVTLYKTSGAKSGGVLVHCFAGISRSASLVIAYLLKHPENIPTPLKIMMMDPVHDTATFVMSKRSLVNPNTGFRKQLSFYHEVLECELIDTQTRKVKEPYRQWIQNRACNNSREVVVILREMEAEMLEYTNENLIEVDFAQ